MAYPKVWWTDGARRLDTSWAAGAVGEALSGTVGVSALGKEVGLAVHTRCFPGRVGLQAWVKQRVHAYCAAASPRDHGRLVSVAEKSVAC